MRERRPREEQRQEPRPRGSLKRAWDREAIQRERSGPARDHDWPRDPGAPDLEEPPRVGGPGKGTVEAASSFPSQEEKGQKSKGKGKGKAASHPKGGEAKRKKRNKGVKRIGWWQKYLERRGKKEETGIEEQAQGESGEPVEEPPEEISDEPTGGGEAAVDERIERWADAEAAGGESESSKAGSTRTWSRN